MRNSSSRSRAEKLEPFVVYSENQLAYEAMLALREDFPNTGSVVYLYGPAGVGKSHLIRDTIAELRQADRKLKYSITTGNELSAEFSQALDEKRLSEFREELTDVKLFVCEDLQGTNRQREMQEFLVGVLDDLERSGCSIILSATHMPRELRHLGRKIVSRCHAATSVLMLAPGAASRSQLLQHFAQFQQLPLPPSVAEFLAQALPVSPRELAATIKQLDVLSRRSKTPIDENFARRYLQEETPPQEVSISQITRAVARQFGVKVRDIRSESRQRVIATPRQCAMFLARELTRQPQQAIASYFGRQNHSTVSHACSRITKLISVEPALEHHLQQIRFELRSGRT